MNNTIGRFELILILFHQSHLEIQEKILKKEIEVFVVPMERRTVDRNENRIHRHLSKAWSNGNVRQELNGGYNENR